MEGLPTIRELDDFALRYAVGRRRVLWNYQETGTQRAHIVA